MAAQVTKKQIMTAAWKVAKQSVNKFGGSAIEYIAGALKMAWAAVKTVNYVQAMQAKGFNYWSTADHKIKRLYLNIKKAGLLKLEYYKSGNIESAEWMGNTISNNEARHLLNVKCYIDLSDDNHELQVKGDATETAIVLEAAKELVA
ncbi:hypothetical protein HCY78_10370 [Limosilactobacillus fermentum]